MEASAVPRAAPAGVSVVLQSPNLLRLASDARLVTLVRERNAGAFETVYNRHHRAILSFCRHMLGDAQEAEDAVQHTFLSAYSDLISSTKQIHLRAWLFTIARNRCYSVLRARREQPASDLDEPITEGLAAQVQRRQDLRDLVVDLQRLPDEQRAALVLAELDALSHEEIAETLGVPPKKVKALVFQARESLLASRVARETDCAEIREQLATQRGGALRRGNLRRHLRECAGCRDYRREIERQRRHLAVLLPVVPTVALREAVLGVTAGGGAAAGLGGAVFSTAIKSGLVKVSIGALVAGVGTAGTLVATKDLVLPPISSSPTETRAATVTPTPTAAPRVVSAEARAAASAPAATRVTPPSRAITRSVLSPLISPAAPVHTSAGSLWIHNASLLNRRALTNRSAAVVLVGPAMPQKPAAAPPSGATPPLATAPVTPAPAPAPVVVIPPASTPATITPPAATAPSKPHDGTQGSGHGSAGSSSASTTGSTGWHHGGTDGGAGSSATSHTGSTSGTSGTSGAPAGSTRGEGGGNGYTWAGSTGTTSGTGSSTSTGTSTGTSSGASSGTSTPTTTTTTTTSSSTSSGTTASATNTGSSGTAAAPNQTTATDSGTPR